MCVCVRARWGHWGLCRWFSRPGIAFQLLSDSGRERRTEELLSESLIRGRQRGNVKIKALRRFGQSVAQGAFGVECGADVGPAKTDTRMSDVVKCAVY